MSSERRGVLVVDDSALMREVIGDILAQSGRFYVAGCAADGHEAIRLVQDLQPDIVTMDVEMPGLDGLHALGSIMLRAPRPVIVLSALDPTHGAPLVLRALELGALDFVRKPSAGNRDALAAALLAALDAAAVANVHGAIRPAQPPPPSAGPHQGPAATRAASIVVAIAASTGGPRALTDVLPQLPADLDAAVLVVQHMPAGFTHSLARRLNALSALWVREAVHGDRLLTGTVYISPGGHDIAVSARSDGAAFSVTPAAGTGARPAADPVFLSVATLFGPRSIGVVLTGMGRDGASGLAAIRRSGGGALVQTPDSAVVPGMPVAAITTAGADRVVPLPEVAGAITEAVLRCRAVWRAAV